MKLLIVESPSKAKTIAKYLGSDFKVAASYGHIRELPSKVGSVLPDEDFKIKYVVSDDSKKHVAQIAELASQASEIYLAPDPDREGESIAWHVVEVLKDKKVLKKNQKIFRVVFNEITKSAVQNAIKNPREIDMDLVNAQQARRALDYLVGFQISPVLWRKLPGSRSAGRVQSVALRLICDRENDIEHFVTREYWSIKGEFWKDNKQKIEASLVIYDGEKLDKFSFTNEKDVNKILPTLEAKKYKVLSIESKKINRNPPPPFTTSTLQQEASRKLGFSAKMTMNVAQKLYEGIKIGSETVGLITYMRTDGVQIAKEALDAARDYISNTYGNKYLPKSPRMYQTKAKNAQEAHEAIRPTSLQYNPDYVRKYLDDVQFKLYDLIWKRLVASQMESVILDSVSVNIGDNTEKFVFRITGSTIEFDGFYRVYREGHDDETIDDESILPKFEKNENLNLNQIKPEQHFTEPPPRYTEASLVKKLEELGIGRPSTYANIISVLQDREYVKLDKKRFLPEERGRFVTAFLENFFNKYVQYDFTANLEEQLDEVSAGKVDWKDILRSFWENFIENVKEASSKPIEEVITRLEEYLQDYIFYDPVLQKVNRKCEKCSDGQLNLRLGKFGPFISCSNYPTCDYSKSNLGYNAPTEQSSSGGSAPVTLGKHPESSLLISVRQGPYGSYIQLGETADGKKLKRVSIPKNINASDITFEQALFLTSLPAHVGNHPDNDKEIKVNIGKFGPYLAYNSGFYSIGKNYDIFNISLEEALDVIAKKDAKGSSPKKPKEAVKTLADGTEIFKGAFGITYFMNGDKKVTIPKKYSLDEIDEDIIKKLTSSKTKKK